MLTQANFSYTELFSVLRCKSLIPFFHVKEMFIYRPYLLSNTTCLFMVPIISYYVSEINISQVYFKHIHTYDNVVCTDLFYNGNYGHFLFDIICSILLFPRDVVWKSKIVLNRSSRRFRIYGDILKCIGLNKSSAHFLTRKSCVYGHNIYFISGVKNCSYNSDTAYILRKKLYSYYSIKPEKSRYLIHWRKGKHRRISNIFKVSNFIQSTFPLLKWEFTDLKNALETVVKLFSTTKLYFTGAGSSVVNAIFMPDGSGVVLYVADYPDYQNNVWLQATRKWTIYFRFHNTRHKYDRIYFTDYHLELLNYSIKAVLNAIERNAWGDVECQTLPLDTCEAELEAAYNIAKERIGDAKLNNISFFDE